MVRPNFSVEDAKQFIKEFGINSEKISSLPSYDDQNFLVEDIEKGKYVLKISHSEESEDLLDFQNSLMRYLQETDLKSIIPHQIPTLQGQMIISKTDNALNSFHIRVVNFLEGIPVSHSKQLHPSWLFSFGETLAKLDKHLLNLPTHKAAQRVESWDIKRVLDRFPLLNLIPDDNKRNLIKTILNEFQNKVVPVFDKLRHSVVHNDPNNDNILIDKTGSKICGIIDFGDSVETCTIAESAIACCYLMQNSEIDPLGDSIKFLKGYNSILKLEEIEIDLLYWFICARLCASLTQSAKFRSENPNVSDDDYAYCSEKSSWKLLEILTGQGYTRVTEMFKLNLLNFQ